MKIFFTEQEWIELQELIASRPNATADARIAEIIRRINKLCKNKITRKK